MTDNFGLTISKKKTEVIHHPALQKPYVEAVITVKGKTFEVVEKFTYLGSMLSRFVLVYGKETSYIANPMQPSADSPKAYRRDEVLTFPLC